ncbi:uncharacterized protein BDR25DRAFT_354357 [Lindgomyces ingoldianus]|uniref:Uncharacterized protein n=1 Tax=Lindgomyces ingoldianus TaxID=673940 RepID=A0ACB6R015_9PLEO|nr:uncharacterized protein BDR25DRAFT_354357 [Lindgomyces ingoldianus]KAF2471852.1 hypothetical protein BDR25DRAFT_354357 [Lindgomyces ingoldianus]
MARAVRAMAMAKGIYYIIFPREGDVFVVKLSDFGSPTLDVNFHSNDQKYINIAGMFLDGETPFEFSKKEFKRLFNTLGNGTDRVGDIMELKLNDLVQCAARTGASENQRKGEYPLAKVFDHCLQADHTIRSLKRPFYMDIGARIVHMNSTLHYLGDSSIIQYEQIIRIHNKIPILSSSSATAVPHGYGSTLLFDVVSGGKGGKYPCNRSCCIKIVEFGASMNNLRFIRTHSYDNEPSSSSPTIDVTAYPCSVEMKEDPPVQILVWGTAHPKSHGNPYTSSVITKHCEFKIDFFGGIKHLEIWSNFDKLATQRGKLMTFELEDEALVRMLIMDNVKTQHRCFGITRRLWQREWLALPTRESTRVPMETHDVILGSVKQTMRNKHCTISSLFLRKEDNPYLFLATFRARLKELLLSLSLVVELHSIEETFWNSPWTLWQEHIVVTTLGFTAEVYITTDQTFDYSNLPSMALGLWTCSTSIAFIDMRMQGDSSNHRLDLENMFIAFIFVGKNEIIKALHEKGASGYVKALDWEFGGKRAFTKAIESSLKQYSLHLDGTRCGQAVGILGSPRFCQSAFHLLARDLLERFLEQDINKRLLHLQGDLNPALHLATKSQHGNYRVTGDSGSKPKHRKLRLEELAKALFSSKTKDLIALMNACYMALVGILEELRDQLIDLSDLTSFCAWRTLGQHLCVTNFGLRVRSNSNAPWFVDAATLKPYKVVGSLSAKVTRGTSEIGYQKCSSMKLQSGDLTLGKDTGLGFEDQRKAATSRFKNIRPGYRDIGGSYGFDGGSNPYYYRYRGSGAFWSGLDTRPFEAMTVIESEREVMPPNPAYDENASGPSLSELYLAGEFKGPILKNTVVDLFRFGRENFTDFLSKETTGSRIPSSVNTVSLGLVECTIYRRTKNAILVGGTKIHLASPSPPHAERKNKGAIEQLGSLSAKSEANKRMYMCLELLVYSFFGSKGRGKGASCTPVHEACWPKRGERL